MNPKPGLLARMKEKWARRASKALRTFAIPPGEYERLPSGALGHAKPRKFRRGRAWARGELVRPERWKFWTL